MTKDEIVENIAHSATELAETTQLYPHLAEVTPAQYSTVPHVKPYTEEINYWSGELDEMLEILNKTRKKLKSAMVKYD